MTKVTLNPHLVKSGGIPFNKNRAECTSHDVQTFLKFSILFRTSNHRLPIETGSWWGIKSIDRKCPLCKCTQCSSSIADEFYYLLECKSLDYERKRFINKKEYFNVLHFKYSNLMSCLNNHSTYIKPCRFIKAIVCLFILTIVTKYNLVYVITLIFSNVIASTVAIDKI